MGVFIISPNDKGGKLYAPPPKLTDLCAPLHPMQFNALYCLNRPQVHTLSCGAARPSDFDPHVAALEHYDDIPTILDPIEKRIRSEMEAVLATEPTPRDAAGKRPARTGPTPEEVLRQIEAGQ